MYQVDGLPCNRIWVVTPSREETDLCGIDMEEYVHVRSHILISIPLPSEYARIAADVSDNDVITAFDLSVLQQFILGNSTGFPINWKFVDASFIFPVPSNPFEAQINTLYPNNIGLSFLNTNAVDQDFIAIKMGDVDCSYDPSCDESPEISQGGSRRSSFSNSNISEKIVLSAHPNPLSDHTTLQFSLIEEGMTSITIYDLSGKQIPSLSINQYYPSGNHQAQLNLAELSKGIYVCVVEQQGYREVLKLTKVK